MTEWILAFDADCGFCEEVAERTRGSVGARLTTAGLTEPRIRGLRERALGGTPVWAPTLLAVDGDHVRAWTGTALSVRLARLLGPVDSLRVVQALREIEGLGRPSRRGVLKVVPGLALGTFLVTGGLAASPAQAVAHATGSRASRWVKAHRDRLPVGYAEFVSHPVEYRRAIYGALPVPARSDLWAAHFAHHRRTHPGLSPAQSAVLDDATRSVARLVSGRAGQPDAASLERSALAVFSHDEVHAILGTLGPVGTQDAAPRRAREVMDCNSRCGGSGHCDMVCYSGPQWCNWTDFGCGPLWLAPCSGVCAP
ncbi:bacteriocin fulvocin C-related protein [Streptomyces sp. NPDC002701]|uniref:bacteriocin fulvocin C-related protein n=1 Tax=Streptomyces sp. NPDC002701 TaxID=3364661 RepID=UPI0036819601